VAESWFKLLTYKDEYEVARLHGATRYDLIAQQLGIEGPYRVKYHLHPPSLRRLGVKHKLPMGWPYALGFAALRRLKWLRGTPFDPFGWDADRRLERQLIVEYQALIDDVLTDADRPYALQVALAASAQEIKGYAAIKERAAEAWRARVRELKTPRPALTAGAAE
jgi:indolepyruvate ferredoxin oxidoreductase